MTITSDAIKPYLLSLVRRATQGICLYATSHGWLTNSQTENLIIAIVSIGAVEIATWINKLWEQYKLEAAKLLTVHATNEQIEAKAKELKQGGNLI